jgi:hypothetical protein
MQITQDGVERTEEYPRCNFSVKSFKAEENKLFSSGKSVSITQPLSAMKNRSTAENTATNAFFGKNTGPQRFIEASNRHGERVLCDSGC